MDFYLMALSSDRAVNYTETWNYYTTMFELKVLRKPVARIW